jgi:uncharacterized membrane protein
MKISEAFHTITHEFKNLFLSGLLTIIPIAATVFFINFAYGFVKRILEPIRLLEPQFLQQIPGSEFVLITVIILAIGIIIKIFIAKTLIHEAEKIISRVPMIRIVYSSAKILVNFFKMPGKSSMEKKVVLITYPKKGQYHLAFLLESAEDSYGKILPEEFRVPRTEKFYKVFMPNSPNPTSGYFFIMPESEIVHTNITFEEALKTLVSCGLVTPESLKNL